MSGFDYSGITPELGEAIRVILDSVLLDVNVALPAKISSYNKATQYADVQIQLYQKFADGSLKLPPPIPNVPVKWQRANAGAAFIHLPLKAGDDVLLIFSQRSLDNWKTQGGASDPGDPRKHHITDAYALVGGSALPDGFTPTTDDSIEMVNGQTHMIIKPGGQVQVINDTGELIDTLDQITQETQTGFQTLGNDTVNTIFGPTLLNSFEEYLTIANQLQSLLTTLESFKV